MVWEVEVLAMGDGWSAMLGRRVNMRCKVGDMLLIPALAGYRYDDGVADAHVHLVEYENVIARLEPRAATVDEVAERERVVNAPVSLAAERKRLLEESGQQIGD